VGGDNKTLHLNTQGGNLEDASVSSTTVTYGQITATPSGYSVPLTDAVSLTIDNRGRYWLVCVLYFGAQQVSLVVDPLTGIRLELPARATRIDLHAMTSVGLYQSFASGKLIDPNVTPYPGDGGEFVVITQASTRFEIERSPGHSSGVLSAGTLQPTPPVALADGSGIPIGSTNGALNVTPSGPVVVTSTQNSGPVSVTGFGGNPVAVQGSLGSPVWITGPQGNPVAVQGSPGGAPLPVQDLALYNPATPGYETQRTPSKFVDVLVVNVTGATQAIWTPAAGKRFRLLGFSLAFSVAGSSTVAYTFVDGAPGASAPAVLRASPPAGPAYVLTLPGNGYLSTAAGNSLLIQGPAATVTGTLFGCEE